MRWHLLLGRLLFGGVLLCAAARQLTDGGLTNAFAAYGIPFPEGTAVASSVIVGLAGTSIVLGAWTQVGLRLIVLYLVPATVLMHAFWTAPDAAARSLELTLFLKNVGLIGAAIALLALPAPWPLSVDAWLARSNHDLSGPWTGRLRGLSARLTTVGDSLRRAFSSLRPAAIGGKSDAVGRSRLRASIVRRDDDDAWDTSIVERPDGTIYRARRAVRTPGGGVLFVQSFRGYFRSPYREYS